MPHEHWGSISIWGARSAGHRWWGGRFSSVILGVGTHTHTHVCNLVAMVHFFTLDCAVMCCYQVRRTWDDVDHRDDIGLPPISAFTTKPLLIYSPDTFILNDIITAILFQSYSDCDKNHALHDCIALIEFVVLWCHLKPLGTRISHLVAWYT